MRGLNARERHIVTERRLRDAPRTLESLGIEMGLSKERVRQLEAAGFTRESGRDAPMSVRGGSGCA